MKIAGKVNYPMNYFCNYKLILPQNKTYALDIHRRNAMKQADTIALEVFMVEGDDLQLHSLITDEDIRRNQLLNRMTYASKTSLLFMRKTDLLVDIYIKNKDKVYNSKNWSIILLKDLGEYPMFLNYQNAMFMMMFMVIILSCGCKILRAICNKVKMCCSNILHARRNSAVRAGEASYNARMERERGDDLPGRDDIEGIRRNIRNRVQNEINNTVRQT